MYKPRLKGSQHGGWPGNKASCGLGMRLVVAWDEASYGLGMRLVVAWDEASGGLGRG